MFVFDGRVSTDQSLTDHPALEHLPVHSYYKPAEPVRAIQYNHPFQVTVSWQTAPLQAQAHDWLVSDDEASWPVADTIFQTSYQHIDGEEYMKIAPVQAVQILEPFQVLGLEGLAQAQAGDFLVRGVSGEAWPIPCQRFLATYKRIT